jgi:NAD(P)-dependent dehydrogenase (short-subunit alcohol dehydrogenase family)
VVTGGSRGIGLAVGKALAAEGARVVLVARGEEALAAAVKEVPGSVGVRADTGSDASVAELAEEVRERLGGVDILVNSAATPSSGRFEESELESEINVKVRGYLRTARAFAPGMTAAGWGRIINISGLAARGAGSLVGSVRNVAVAAVTKNLADELGPQGVNVVVVHPGLTRTERTPETLAAMAAARGVEPADVERAAAAGVSIGRLVTAEEVASVVAFLASPLSVSINGDAIAVGGGAKGPIFY